MLSDVHLDAIASDVCWSKVRDRGITSETVHTPGPFWITSVELLGAMRAFVVIPLNKGVTGSCCG
jgi:hypothetical protein